MASRCVMMLCCCNVDVFAAILALGFFFKMAASHSTMFDILVKVGLGEHYGVFLEQKITADIVCCLAAIEMQQLGISTKMDMVKLRSECTNYGIRKPQRSQ